MPTHSVTVLLPQFMHDLPAPLLGVLVERLALSVYVFKRNHLVYTNAAATALQKRLRASYRIELEVMLRDHLAAVLDRTRTSAEAGTFVSLLTATNGEPFYVHVIPLAGDPDEIAITVRVIGAEIEAFRRRYGLSAREAQVAELVLHGYRNTDIASTLGIAPATTKKHLTRIFDKVGVDTRSQLQTRLA